MKQAVYYVPDLFFEPRIADGLKRLDFTAHAITQPAAVAGNALLVIQLDGPRDRWLALIGAARDAGVPVLAFGRHTDAETLRAARQAGADKVVPNSQLVAELPELVAALVKQTP